VVTAAKVIYDVLNGIFTTACIVGGGVLWYLYSTGHIVVTNLTKHITVITITY
jgi:hypothetical protein